MNLDSLTESYNLGQNKMEHQNPHPHPHPHPQIKDDAARRAKTRHFPILDLGGRGGLGFPFILSKIVGSYPVVQAVMNITEIAPKNSIYSRKYDSHKTPGWRLHLQQKHEKRTFDGAVIVLIALQRLFTLVESIFSNFHLMNERTDESVKPKASKRSSTICVDSIEWICRWL